MELYVKNKELSTIGIVDTAKSVIWTERYRGGGDFEIYLPATKDSIDLLKMDYYIMRQDVQSVMIIEKIEIEADEENGDFLIISGSSLESILRRRIVWNQTNLYGNAEIAIRKLLIENIISPELPKRKISNFALKPKNGYPDTIEMQMTGDNLENAVKEICSLYDWGYRVVLEESMFIFDLYKGTDRSYNQTINPHVTFSGDFDNLFSNEYLFSKMDYKNVALIAGEGEGLERITADIGTVADLERRELYIDARHISSDDGEIENTSYMSMLKDEGKRKLELYSCQESFEGTGNHNAPYCYKTDYYLGDVVQVINDYGIAKASRIIEVTEVEDESGYQVIPVFSFENKGGE